MHRTLLLSFALSWLAFLPQTLAVAVSGTHSEDASSASLSPRSAASNTHLFPRTNNPAEPERFLFSSSLQLSASELAVEQILSQQRTHLLTYLQCAGKGSLPFTEIPSFWLPSVPWSPLYDWFKAMPKGSLGHIHSSGTTDAEWLINRAFVQPRTFVYWTDNKARDSEYIKGQLMVFPAGQKVPTGFVPINELAKRVPNLKRQLVKMITVNVHDHADPTSAWVDFEDCFTRADGLIKFRPVFVDYYIRTFKKAAADGVQLFELRTGISSVSTPSGKLETDGKVIDIFKYARDVTRQTYPDFQLRIIQQGYRVMNTSQAHARATRALRLSKAYPEIVSNAFDMVGGEDVPGHHGNGYYKGHINIPGLRMFLHSGESLNPNNTNINDALEMDAKRMSHLINLGMFPGLEAKLRAKSVVAEVLPISNLLLRYVKDIRQHPALGWMKRGLQMFIGSDDPGVLITSPLSDDFLAAYLAWNLDLKSLKQFILTSIKASSLDQKEKNVVMGQWKVKWEKWIDMVISQSKSRGIEDVGRKAAARMCGN